MKKLFKHLGLVVFAALATTITASQDATAQVPRFQVAIGDTNSQQGRGVKQLSDSGYVIAGYTKHAGTGEDVYLIRTDRNGNRLWSYTYDIRTGNDYGYSVDIASDGGFIVTGKTQNTGNCTQDDIFLLKTNSAGTLLWTRTFGGSGNDEGALVQRTSDNGFIVAGRTNSFGAGNYDGYLLKTDGSGNLTWWQTYGGSSVDFFQSVHQTSDGGYIAAGGTDSYGNGTQAFVVRTNGSGVLQWGREYGGSGQDFIWSVRQTNDGGYITAGMERSYAPNSSTADLFLVKLTSTGALSWARTYGFGLWDEALYVKECTDQSLIICGYTQSEGISGFNGTNAYMLKTNFAGARTWERIYGGNNTEYGWEVVQTSDGGFAFTGRTSSFGAGSDDVYLVKTEQNGVTPCNTAAVTSATSTPTVSITSISPNVASINMSFAVTATRYTLGTGNVLCFTQSPLSLFRPTGDHSTNTGDNAVVSQDYQAQVSMLKSTARSATSEHFTLRPNPIQSEAAFVVSYNLDNASDIVLSVSDMLGKTIHQSKHNVVQKSGNIEVTTTNWAKGMYMVTIQSSIEIHTLPIIVR